MAIITQNSALQIFTYRQAQETYEEIIWKDLGKMTIKEGCERFLNTLENYNTKRTYGMRFHKLFKLGLLNPNSTLDYLAIQNTSNLLLDQISAKVSNNDASRQLHSAAFISLTNYLSRLTGGIVKKALPIRFGHNKTFYQVRDKVLTEPIESKDEWDRFLSCLTTRSLAVGIMGKLMLQGGKRLSEVLNLNISDINFEKREISFKINKKKGLIVLIIISVSDSIIDEIKVFLNSRTVGKVFLSTAGKVYCYPFIKECFNDASALANMPFRVRPHTMRCTMVTYYRNRGFSYDDIIKITGQAHATAKKYDKTDIRNNLSKHMNLVG